MALGKWRRWLDTKETLLAAGLLAIPYVTRAHEMGMASTGRFALVVFPVYLVLGHLLARMPTAVAAALLALSAAMLAMYAALFSAGYLVF